jgi:hypothetical protein
VESAIQITMIDLQNPVPPNAPCCPPPDFSRFESGIACTDPSACIRWVGPAGSFLESQDNAALGSFAAARLQCTPYYRDWGASDAIHVVGGELLPSSKYDVRVYPVECRGEEGTCFAVSDPVSIETRRAGDIAPSYNPPSPTTQPDALDVAAAVNKFKSLPGAPSKSIAQVQPNVPELDADVSALDIAAIVDNAKGFAYPYSGPCACPSTVPCNATPCGNASACTSLYGAGATCVKTCDDGPNLGLPCNNHVHCGRCVDGARAGYPCDADSDCPGSTCGTGTCGSGFCRDRCGRCEP